MCISYFCPRGHVHAARASPFNKIPLTAGSIASTANPNPFWWWCLGRMYIHSSLHYIGGLCSCYVKTEYVVKLHPSVLLGALSVCLSVCLCLSALMLLLCIAGFKSHAHSCAFRTPRISSSRIQQQPTHRRGDGETRRVQQTGTRSTYVCS